jgi:hypothetical protein
VRSPTCPQCAKEGNAPEWIRTESSTRTLMGYETYYDKDRRYHCHDPNRTMTRYSCSMGHEWSEESPSITCAACEQDPKT